MEIIKIKQIPLEGLKINDQLCLSALNERMQEAKDNEIIFNSAPVLNLIVNAISQGVTVSGQLTTDYKQPCARCNKNLDYPLKLEIDLILKPKNPKNNSVEEEAHIIYYEEDALDLEDILQESIILSLNPFQSPKCKKNGDCTVCGFNLKQYCDSSIEEEKQSKLKLGDLLKKALDKN